MRGSLVGSPVVVTSRLDQGRSLQLLHCLGKLVRRQVQSRAGGLQGFERPRIHHFVVVAQDQRLHLPFHQANVDVVSRLARLLKRVEALEGALSDFAIIRELKFPVPPAIFLAIGLVDGDRGIAALDPDWPTKGTAQSGELFGNCVEASRDLIRVQ